MIKVKTDRTVSIEGIEKIKQLYPVEEIMIVLDNTKLQSEEVIKLIGQKYPNVKFSVIGGLNPDKRKFDGEYYQKRTYFTGMELGNIIHIYKEIEKRIDLTWTDTQKAMFVYQQLCNNLTYDECSHNGRNYARGIGRLLYGKAVCSGFAMIYKEAMDRLGIECHYQNRTSHHSWNILKLDGKYRAVELTWDTSSKGKEGCGFRYFNRDGDFYGNEHHDISGEAEEVRYPIVPYSKKELQDNYAVIQGANTLTIPLKQCDREMSVSGEIRFNDSPCKIYTQNGIIGLSSPKDVKHKTFIRDDGSSFIVIPSTLPQYKGTNKYLVIEAKDGVVKASKIYTETELEKGSDADRDHDIANGLLSHERLNRKINDFNGYVGYVGKNHEIHYNPDFEREALNVIR